MIKQFWRLENGVGHWVLQNAYGDEITCDDNDVDLREARLELMKKEQEIENKAK